MDDKERKSRLTASLQKAMALSNIASSDDYRNHLRPYLEELSLIHPKDPSDFKTSEELTDYLRIENQRASVYRSLISFLDQQPKVVERIRAELKNPSKNHGI